jgi:hypothetical protein
VQIGTAFACRASNDVAAVVVGIRDTKTLAKHKDVVDKLVSRMLHLCSGELRWYPTAAVLGLDGWMTL